jgi:hypothetical protein
VILLQEEVFDEEKEMVEKEKVLLNQKKENYEK